MTKTSRSVLPLMVPFLAITVVHLIGQSMNHSLTQELTKPLLIPLLMIPLWLLVAKRDQPFWLIQLGLLFSWFGDLALMIRGDLWFMIGLGMFLLAHVSYVWLFIKYFTLQRWHSLSSLYLIWYVTLLVILYPYLGGMLIPVAVYGLVLGAMGFTATRSGATILFGGMLFVISDSLLALNRFLPTELYSLEYNGFLVMLSYCFAQFFIVYGVQAELRKRIDNEKILLS